MDQETNHILFLYDGTAHSTCAYLPPCPAAPVKEQDLFLPEDDKRLSHVCLKPLLSTGKAGPARNSNNAQSQHPDSLPTTISFCSCFSTRMQNLPPTVSSICLYFPILPLLWRQQKDLESTPYTARTILLVVRCKNTPSDNPFWRSICKADEMLCYVLEARF